MKIGEVAFGVATKHRVVMGEVFNTERDARLVAESWDINYPQDKPHRAVRVKLVEVGEDGEVRDGE